MTAQEAVAEALVNRIAESIAHAIHRDAFELSDVPRYRDAAREVVRAVRAGTLIAQLETFPSAGREQPGLTPEEALNVAIVIDGGAWREWEPDDAASVRSARSKLEAFAKLREAAE